MTKPTNIMNIIQGRSRTTAFRMRTTDDLTKGFTIEIWIKILNGTGNGVIRNIIVADSVIKLRLNSLNL